MLFFSLCLSLLCTGSYGAQWSYSGANGVDEWDDIFEACNGSSQSPVDLSSKTKAQLPSFTFTNFDTVKNVTWKLINNGHAAQVVYQSGDLRVSGGGLPGEFKVAQFHFHWGHNSSVGSEHTIKGRQYPMEMHVVTHNLKYGDSLISALPHADGLAVLGVFFRVNAKGRDNPRLRSVVNALDRIREPGASVSIRPIPLRKLLPRDRIHFYRYQGSLTTPTCNEVVTWTIFRRPIRISEKQLEAFRSLESSEGDHQPMVDNFRPTQPLHGREVQQS